MPWAKKWSITLVYLQQKHLNSMKLHQLLIRAKTFWLEINVIKEKYDNWQFKVQESIESEILNTSLKLPMRTHEYCYDSHYIGKKNLLENIILFWVYTNLWPCCIIHSLKLRNSKVLHYIYATLLIFYQYFSPNVILKSTQLTKPFVTNDQDRCYWIFCHN